MMSEEWNESTSTEYAYIRPVEKSGDSLIGYKVFKRIFDVISSACLLVLISWLLVIVAVAVKLTSKGPAFFLDHRVGLNGKDIRVLKFRTMFIDAEEHIHEYLNEEQYQAWQTERKVENDPRVTPVGRFLRKTSIDELPQLFNILKGDLSVVGPRPLSRTEIEEHFAPEEREKLLSCKPGLTGNWAAYGRSTITYESGERQRLELEYVDRRSTFLDFKLIFMTAVSVLKGEGAQ